MSNNQNYNQTTYNYMSDDTTITLDTASLPSLTTSDIITISGSGGTYDYSSWNSGMSTTISNSSNYTINSSSSYFGIPNTASSVNITANGMEMPEGSDIKIGEKSLKTFMDKMEKRLAILQPDPKKLEKFEALQKAYNHYKTLEALCDLEEDNEQE